MFDPRRLRELLELAGAPLLAIGALATSVTAGVKWLNPILSDYLGSAVATPLAIFLPLLGASSCISAAHHALAKKSRLLRPDRFDLRVRKQGDLLGGSADVIDLKALTDDNVLLLIDGESGSGKSSLVTFGLIPALSCNPVNAPVLVSDYSGDWDTELSKGIFNAAWLALAADERTKAGFTERPAISAIDADTVLSILKGIGTRLGRMPNLILDQFDDYQLAAREHFMGRRRDWIRPSDLIRRNRTWAVIRGLLREGTARLIVVTRSGRQCRAAPKSLHDGSDHLACNAQPHKLWY